MCALCVRSCVGVWARAGGWLPGWLDHAPAVGTASNYSPCTCIPTAIGMGQCNDGHPPPCLSDYSESESDEEPESGHVVTQLMSQFMTGPFGFILRQQQTPPSPTPNMHVRARTRTHTHARAQNHTSSPLPPPTSAQPLFCNVNGNKHTPRSYISWQKHFTFCCLR